MAQISYPFTGGSRHSPASAELRFGAPINAIVIGWTSIDYSAKLEPEMVYANHPDPIGRTLGRATYEASIEVYLAEFKQQLLDSLGAGWATQSFDITVTWTENGFDTFTDHIIGCRLLGYEQTISNDAAAIKRKVELKPLKILTNNVDMLAVPLTGVQG